MSDREKELTILAHEGCKLTPEMLPFWEYCRNLGVRMDRHLGGISIKFGSFAALYCEFWWKGKSVATIYAHGSTDTELRVVACYRSSQFPLRYPKNKIWEEAFRPALNYLIAFERMGLEAIEKRVDADLP